MRTVAGEMNNRLDGAIGQPLAGELKDLPLPAGQVRHARTASSGLEEDLVQVRAEQAEQHHIAIGEVAAGLAHEQHNGLVCAKQLPDAAAAALGVTPPGYPRYGARDDAVAQG
ncbi:MAG: hypothetical protein ACRDVG_14060 [Jatrophihabitantaceae bacterium]